MDGDNPLYLVLTLRADFLGHCTEQAYSGLGQRLQHHALLLVAPTAGELREAITRPLELVGMRCEQVLEDELVDQTLHAKGSLPLLQYVLEKLWQSARQERSRELTLAMYQQLGGQHGGGLRGVLNEKADAFYQQLEPQQQRLMEWLMVELTQVGDGQDDTRRTVTLQELHNRQPQYTAALDALLAQLVTHERLLTQDHDDCGQATITVAHEALIRDWQRLRGWLESNREIKSWRLRLEDSISAWKNNISGSLLREKRLLEAQQILDKYPDSLLIGQDEQAFITTSQIEAKRRKQLQTGAVVGFIVVLLVGIIATAWQWREAERQAKSALQNKLISQSALAVGSPSSANGYVAQGLLLAVQAFNMNKTLPSAQAALNNGLQTAGHLQKTWYGHKDAVTAIAFSPDGKYIVTGSEDKTLRLWDAINERNIGKSWTGHNDWVNSVAFSPDGKYVVSGSEDKTLRLWDATNGQVIGKPWQEQEYGVSSVVFSPDGKHVVSGSNDNNLQLWDVKSGMPIGKPWEGHEHAITAIALSPDGKYVVSAGLDATVRLWDVESAHEIEEPWIHGYRVFDVAFSPDGKHVISSDFADMQLWDLSGQKIGEPWSGHKGDLLLDRGGITGVKFSSDGKHVISSGGDSDNTIRYWNIWDELNETITPGKAVGEPWYGNENGVSSIAFSPDDKYVASAGRDHTVRLWNMAKTGQTLIDSWQNLEEKKIIEYLSFSTDNRQVLSGGDNLQIFDVITGKLLDKRWHKYEGYGIVLALSPSGKQLLADDKGNVFLWNAEVGKTIGTSWKASMSDGFPVAAFSPDGQYVISNSEDNVLWLRNATNGQVIGKPWGDHKDKISEVLFSPDGQYVVSRSGEKTVQLWDVKTGQPHGRAWRDSDANTTINKLVFSSDGKRILASTTRFGFVSGNDLQLLDSKTGQAIGEPWRGHEDGITVLAFSPDGKRAVSGSLDKTLRLWNTEKGQSIGEPWRGHESSIDAVAFSPNGQYVVSYSADGVFKLWDADPESWAKKACSIVNRNFSLAEWQRFIGDALPYQKTCPDLPAPGEEGWVEPYAGG